VVNRLELTTINFAYFKCLMFRYETRLEILIDSKTIANKMSHLDHVCVYKNWNFSLKKGGDKIVSTLKKYNWHY
jgi:hypothetical protein